MSARGEMYVSDDCVGEFEKELNEWYGEGKWKLDGNEFSDCWDINIFPASIRVKVLSSEDETEDDVIGEVEIENDFYVEGDDLGRSIEIQPKSIKRVK